MCYPHGFFILMADDRSGKIIKRVDKFIEHVGARGHGWEVRFAQKFGVIYAAMMMGIDAGLLPWPRGLPRRVATKCYRSARNAAKTDQERAAEAIAKLHHFIETGAGIVDGTHADRSVRPIKISSGSIAIKFIKEGRSKYGFLDEPLRKVLRTKKAKAVFTKRLAKAALLPLGHGHAGTVQEHLKIERDGEVVDRPRLWVLDAAKLKQFVAKHNLDWATGPESRRRR